MKFDGYQITNIILNEISLSKKIAARTLRAYYGKGIGPAVQSKLDVIDNITKSIQKNPEKISRFRNIAQAFGASPENKLNSEEMVKHLRRTRAKAVLAAKAEHRSMMNKIAGYGVVPPVASTAIGIGASYDASRRYSDKNKEKNKYSTAEIIL